MSLVTSPTAQGGVGGFKASDSAGMTQQLHFAALEAWKRYGHRISFTDSPRTLVKYGINDDANTTIETVWHQGGVEDYINLNFITHLVSTNALDNQVVWIEGHTGDLVNGFTRVTQEVQITGQTGAPLTTPLARVERLRNVSTTEFLGTLSVYENGTTTDGVVDDQGLVHLNVPAHSQQSLKCAFTTALNEYVVITGGEVGIAIRQSISAQFRLRTQAFGSVMLTKKNIAASSNSGAVPLIADPYYLIPPNTDVLVDVEASASAFAQATIRGYYAIITNL